MGITADIAYSKAKKLFAGLQSGFDHATETKNADGTVTMTMYFTNGTNVPLTFPKPNDGEKGDDGASVVSASVKNKHLILTKDDGTDIDCGLLPTSDYDDTELRTAIDGKVDKVTGKSLVDDAEIARLANVDNYDDTAIKATIKTVSDGLMASAGYSADYKTIDIVTVGGDKKSIDVKPVIEHANIGELADVDSTNKGNGKALVFNEATGKHEYSASSGTDELVKMDASGDAKYLGDLLDKVTVVNESGVLKVKKLDGQEVTIEEINYLKGLTMNVMDLVNLFANGGVKIINTPVSTYADLLAYDKSSLIEGISYLVYVLSDETHGSAKTTYLIDKNSSTPTYFGFADSHRDFVTNPISLVNEITGKLGVANIDVDDLSALLSVSVDDTYKTLTTTSNSFGTHGAKALYDELVQAIGLKANTSDLTSHTDDVDIHVTSAERTSWNGKVDKSSVATTIDSTCTHEQVSSAKALYEVISLFNDEIGKSAAVADLTAEADKGQKAKRICYWDGNTLNTPYKAGITTATTGYAILTSNTNTYATIICFATGIDNIYTLRKQSGTWAAEWSTLLSTNNVTDSISSSSTNNKIPSALSVYSELSKRMPFTSDIFESTNFLGVLKNEYGFTGDNVLQDILTALNGNQKGHRGPFFIYTNSNNSAFNKSLPEAAGGCVIILSSAYSFKNNIYDRGTVIFMPYRSTSDMWINPYIDAVLTGWRKIASTRIPDVPPTDIKYLDETNYAPSAGCDNYYIVRNGICYVTLSVNIVSPKTSGSVTICNTMPKALKTFRTQLSSPTANANANVIIVGSNLMLEKGAIYGYNTVSFSYPVAES